MGKKWIRRLTRIAAISLGVSYALTGAAPSPFWSGAIMVLAGLRLVYIAMDLYEACRRKGS